MDIRQIRMMKAIDVLQVIARGYDKSIGGNLRAIPRMEMVGMCREICDQHGLTYAQSDIGLNGNPDDHEPAPAAPSAGETAELEVLLVSSDHDADAPPEEVE